MPKLKRNGDVYYFLEKFSKKRPVFKKSDFLKTGHLCNTIKFAHCTGSKLSGLKKWPFWDYWEIADFFGIKEPKALAFTRVFGYRRNIAK